MAERGPKLPFWIHQAVEYLIGLIVLFESARLPHAVVGLAAGFVVIGLASAGQGPLAAFRRVPRHVHRIADLVAIVLFPIAAVVLHSTIGTKSSTVLVVVALALGALSWRTDYRPPEARVPLRDRLPKVDAERVGRGAGRVVGSAAVAGRSWWRSRKA